MRALAILALPSALAGALAQGAGDFQGIVRVPLPPEREEHRTISVPTEAENTVELDFPWPVLEWAGRGFTPDAEKYAGDFVVEAPKGTARVFVTPVSPGAHRVLDLVVQLPDGSTRGIPVEFVPAPAGLAWRKAVFDDESPRPEAPPRFTLSAEAPHARFRAPSPESLLGLVTTLRLMLNTTEAGARAIAAANPALGLAELRSAPESFGDFVLTPRFAVRDATTDSLGICVGVENATNRRLVFDPSGWTLRAGDRVYPVTTVDFSGDLGPGAAAAALLVIGRAPDGLPTLLLPDNAFRISARVLASENPRPVLGIGLPGLGP